jgi:Ala-tRNA(Pro) deacylase
MAVKKLKDFLDRNGVEYISIQHSPAYTAQKIAALAHVKGRNLAKPVMVRLDGRMVMAVLPSKYRVDLDLLREATRAGKAELARETEFSHLFPNCDTGAEPPFGNLWNLPVYVDKTLAEDKEIAFNAGSHSELVQLSYEDYARLVEPKVLSFSRPER